VSIPDKLVHHLQELPAHYGVSLHRQLGCQGPEHCATLSLP